MNPTAAPRKRRAFVGEKKKGFVWVKIAIFAVLAMVFMSGPLLWYYSFSASGLSGSDVPASSALDVLQAPDEEQPPTQVVTPRLRTGRRRAGDRSLPGLSILILCFNELKSLESSLKTWDDGGVFDNADEVIVYFQGRTPAKDAFIQPYVDAGKITKVLGDHRAFPIGAGVNWLVGNASFPLVLFLEKDFALIENEKFVTPRLDEGRAMLADGEVDVVRYRSRLMAGNPNYAQGMFEGREHVILMRQPNLYCSVHYWLSDEQLLQKPHTRYLWKCPKTRSHFCTKSKFCNWTNNPQMFRRDWFIEKYQNKINEILQLTPPHNDLEYFMNWNFAAWNDAEIKVGLGEGLFTHKEIGEHGSMNFDSVREKEKESDNTEDCDLGRRLSEEDCRRHHCTWQPGHPTATCWGVRGRLEDCGAQTEQECLAIDRCFWNPWTVWLESPCMRDIEPPLP